MRLPRISALHHCISFSPLSSNIVDLGLIKAQYAVGYFTEMGIGCRRDPLEANVWYVRAAEQGDERAKQRIAAIRAAADGANPATSARGGALSRKGGANSHGQLRRIGPLSLYSQSSAPKG